MSHFQGSTVITRWSTVDFTLLATVKIRGVTFFREVTEQTLNMKRGSKPVKQGMHHFNQEKRNAISEELRRFLAAGFIKDV
jgi:hypothetical protein